jgi:hypothetical protein
LASSGSTMTLRKLLPLALPVEEKISDIPIVIL